MQHMYAKLQGGVEVAYRHIWWTPCCVHAMNNALKDMGKIAWIRNVVNDGREVQMFIALRFF